MAQAFACPIQGQAWGGHDHYWTLHQYGIPMGYGEYEWYKCMHL